MPFTLCRERMRWMAGKRRRNIRRRAGRSNPRNLSATKTMLLCRRSEAFRIEYWALEEAKLQRMPAEAEFSRKIALVIGGGSGIGREVALLLARKGAHIVVADMNEPAIEGVAKEVAVIASSDAVAHTVVDISSSASLREAIQLQRKTVWRLGHHC